MKRINDAIKTRGVIPWFDEERLIGEIRHDMIEGIENSDVIVVFVTETYRDKVNQPDGRDNDVWQCYGPVSVIEQDVH